MSLHTLSNSMEQAIVNNGKGWGEKITYRFRSTQQNVTVNAMVQSLESSKEDDRHSTLVNNKIFMSVFLENKPSKGDIISYEGETWNVKTYEGNNPYDLICTDSRHGMGRSGRRES
ncbi:hypothetical protein TPMD03_64 [Thiohalocapsa phage LS06-2018-MD03]|nr:hypothetical protein TPMD03_64 [Thiohalocapsa phage LS06-2018-MD03]